MDESKWCIPTNEIFFKLLSFLNGNRLFLYPIEVLSFQNNTLHICQTFSYEWVTPIALAVSWVKEKCYWFQNALGSWRYSNTETDMRKLRATPEIFKAPSP